MKKSAFSMLELVFVIVVIGIIAAMVIPRMNRDSIFEATNQVLNHIKYTQHLAMTEDVYDDMTPNWFIGRWQIQFNNCQGYTVYRDANLNAAIDTVLPLVIPPVNPVLNPPEVALDPQTQKYLGTSAGCAKHVDFFDKMRLNANYNIINIALTPNCANGLAFDTLGRPYSNINNVNGVLQANCQITLTDGSGNSEIIRVHPETGYACMLDAAGNNCL